MKNKILIIWEKWIDPFGADIDETKWNSYHEDNDVDYDLMLEDEEIKSKLTKPIKVISTPMGLIPYNEHTSSSKIFNFWVGHTNFNVTKEISDIIELCSGVEILDIFTRYRFRIGIGKCFNDREIMTQIKNKIQEYFDDKKSE
jgi:hypothetical protein